jgi:hypothetical protein
MIRMLGLSVAAEDGGAIVTVMARRMKPDSRDLWEVMKDIVVAELLNSSISPMRDSSVVVHAA